KARIDPLLGPIFNRVIDGQWDTHLARMCDFWSSVLLMSGRFKGAPMQRHAVIEGLGKPHFERWLMLFRATVAEVDVGDDARALFVHRAEQIGASLLLGIAAMRSGLVGAGAPA